MRAKNTKLTDNCNTTRIDFKSISWRFFRSILRLAPLPMLLLIQNTDAQQVIDNVDLDGLGKSAIVVRSTTTTPQMQAGRYANSAFTFTVINDPGVNYRLLGANKIDAGSKSDLLFQNIINGDFGEASAWLDFDSSKQRLIRNVKRTWDVQAVGDLDGDGFGDLVWRYVVSESPDTGVSYIWFTSGAPSTTGPNVTQVRKRGGAPLTWKLLGAADLDGNGAADMVYISPEGLIKVLMATPNRTCANLSAGSVPTGMTPLKFSNFSGDGRGDILYRNSVTGAVQLAKLNANGINLPQYAGLPDDQNASCTASSLTIPNTVVTLPTTASTWQLYAVGDYDGNGITDIVWLQPNGQLTLWLMNLAGAAPTVIANAGTAPFTVPATESGTLSDSAIAGVAYSTSSGVTGVTDASGKYKFNVGDTVTFTLGTLTLGTVTASGVISPVQLAAGNATKLTNLLVLFQSLDADGNPNNGINITSPTAAAVTGAIDLTSSPTTFASSANTALQSAITAGGLTGAIKTVDQANQHFASQAFALFSANIYGAVNGTSGVFVRFSSTGEYLQGQATPDVFNGSTKIETAGVEYGTAAVTTFDTNGYRLQGTPSVDTNLTAGLSNPGTADRALPQGDSVKFNGGGILSKIENIPGTIVGAWALSPTAIKTQTFIFGSNGRYMMTDPIGDTGSPTQPSCGGPGVELGSYSYNTATRTLSSSNIAYDTNGCGGLHDTTSGNYGSGFLTLNADGTTATFQPSSPNDPPKTIYRISK